MPDFKEGDITTLDGKRVKITRIYPDGTADIEPAEERSFGGFLGNVVKSGGQMVGDLASTVAHPIDTGKNLFRLAKGAAELAIPGEQGDEDVARAAGQFYKDRYGGWENIKNTLYEDPVGALADASTVLGGAGGAAKAAGALSKSANVAKVG